MKKFLFQFVAIVLLVFNSTMFVSYASEEPGKLVLSFPEKKIEVGVPEKYQYVIDENNSYRSDMEELGIDLDDLRYDFSYSRALCFYAFMNDDEGYWIQTAVKAKEADGLTGDLRDWDKDHIELLGSQLQGNIAENIGRRKVFLLYKNIYRAENGDPYMTFVASDISGEEESFTSIYCTLIDGWFYYFMSKSYNPDVDKEALKANVEEMIALANFPDRTAVAEEAVDEESSEQISEDQANTTDDTQNKDDLDEKIANLYFLAGKCFAFLVVIAIVIAIIASKSSKKKSNQNTRGNDTSGY